MVLLLGYGPIPNEVVVYLFCNFPLTVECVPGVGGPFVCRFVVCWCYNCVGVKVLGVGFGVVVVWVPPNEVAVYFCCSIPL